MKLLHINSSILGAASASRRLSAAVVAQWRLQHPDGEVVTRDLAAAPLAHLGGEIMAMRGMDPSEPSPEVRHALAIAAEVMEEFLSADVVVVGAPMYNFGIPSQLKAWIDRLAVPGKTFTYTEQGPRGLAGGKTVIVASSRGGYYGDGTPLAAIDFQEKYLSAVFGFFGITDIRFLRAEGVNISPENRRQAIEAAERDAPQLVVA
ncbi:FMN-dependent NADH-azoreductase (plasmid) [Brevundimonas staleyi]|uniref:FMN dependent NADH:quinone oxidoreductase n=1 Tax=Brevundimonas staleyi TaxID=74326 RepID=A0ABW0FPF0_9CAUL